MARLPLRSPGATQLRDVLAVRSAERAELARTMRTAISLATSPAAWPPMPSATMKMPRVSAHQVIVFVARPDHAYIRAGRAGEVHGPPLSQQHERGRQGCRKSQQHDDESHRRPLRGRRHGPTRPRRTPAPPFPPAPRPRPVPARRRPWRPWSGCHRLGRGLLVERPNMSETSPKRSVTPGRAPCRREPLRHQRTCHWWTRGPRPSRHAIPPLQFRVHGADARVRQYDIVVLPGPTLAIGVRIGNRVPLTRPDRPSSDAMGEGMTGAAGSGVAGMPCMVSLRRSTAPGGGPSSGAWKRNPSGPMRRMSARASGRVPCTRSPLTKVPLALDPPRRSRRRCGESPRAAATRRRRAPRRPPPPRARTPAARRRWRTRGHRSDTPAGPRLGPPRE